jgi:periplasmic protein TonB
MFASRQRAPFAPWPARRFAAALAASAFVHVLLTTALAPGGGGRGGPALPPAPIALAAQLVRVEPPPLPLAAPPIERTATPARAVPRARTTTAPVTPPHAVESAGEGSSGIPDATYYGVRQLDIFPAPEGAFELRYPQRAAAADVKGRVALLVLIDADGTVNEVSVVDAHPAGYFEDDALRVLRAARFRPALKGGRTVRSRIVIEVSYGGG